MRGAGGLVGIPVPAAKPASRSASERLPQLRPVRGESTQRANSQHTRLLTLSTGSRTLLTDPDVRAPEGLRAQMWRCVSRHRRYKALRACSQGRGCRRRSIPGVCPDRLLRCDPPARDREGRRTLLPELDTREGERSYRSWYQASFSPEARRLMDGWWPSVETRGRDLRYLRSDESIRPATEETNEFAPTSSKQILN